MAEPEHSLGWAPTAHAYLSLGLFSCSDAHADLCPFLSQERNDERFCKSARVTQEKIKTVKEQIIWIALEPLVEDKLESGAGETMFWGSLGASPSAGSMESGQGLFSPINHMQ